jgi:hypothetical protein
MDIDYTNFKNGVEKTQGIDRHMLYMRVWGVMKNAEYDMENMKLARETSKANVERQKELFGNDYDLYLGHEAPLDLEQARKARNARLRDRSGKFRKGRVPPQEEVDYLIRDRVVVTPFVEDGTQYGLDEEDLEQLHLEPEDAGPKDEEN